MMTIDAIIMCAFSYAFFVGGFTWGLIKIFVTESKNKKEQ